MKHLIAIIQKRDELIKMLAQINTSLWNWNFDLISENDRLRRLLEKERRTK